MTFKNVNVFHYYRVIYHFILDAHIGTSAYLLSHFYIYVITEQPDFH